MPANWTAPPYWTPPAAATPEEATTNGRLPIKNSETTVGSAPTPLPFVAITPCRVIDTRSVGLTGQWGPPSMLGVRAQRSFDIAGQCGIPSDAQAVSFNFTVWAPVTRGDIRVFPKGLPTPTVATLNWEANIQALANAAVVPLGTGAITVQVDGPGTIDLIVDVNGYYSALGVVNSVNALSGAVTLSPGPNTSITPSGQTLTISSAGSISGVTVGGGLSGGGSAGTVDVTLPPSGVMADRIASNQVVKSVNNLKDDVTIQGGGGVEVASSGGVLTIGMLQGSMTLGSSNDTRLIAAGWVEAGSIALEAWMFTGGASGAPAARSLHSAVWTGSRMIVWGGAGAIFYNDGGRYDPVTNSWAPVQTTGAPSARYQHTAVWTGSRMVVWGGFGGSTGLDTGGIYNPATDSWAATTTVDAPVARVNHTAVWTGSKMIVWGGYGGTGTLLNTGGSYNPATDSWTATTTTNAPVGRASHSAVWTGSLMIVWGGADGPGSRTNGGGLYFPPADVWTTMTTTGAPAARESHTAVWTGSRMLVWGGGGPGVSTEVGQWDENTLTWSVTAAPGAPAARYQHTAVWTGSKMIVWGGFDFGGQGLNTGGVFNPSLDAWSPTATANAPPARVGHSAVWTGLRMVVWGGFDGVTSFDSGGQWSTVSLYVKN